MNSPSFAWHPCGKQARVKAMFKNLVPLEKSYRNNMVLYWYSIQYLGFHAFIDVDFNYCYDFFIRYDGKSVIGEFYISVSILFTFPVIYTGNIQ